MLEDLLELYDFLIQKERVMNNTLHIVSSVKGNHFLEGIMVRTEKLIVKALGGQHIHWKKVNQFNDAFFQYRHNLIKKEQLISIINETIG